MRRVRVAAVMAACCVAGGAWGQGAGGQAPVETPPDWLRKPTAASMRAAFPSQATADKGQVRVTCLVTVQGLLRNCQVDSETPEGQGFGSAALVITPQLLFRPATRDGRPVESEVTIPFNFDCYTSCKRLAEGGRTVVSGVNWTEAPTQTQMVAAYPAKARAQHILGVASIQCRIGDDGGLNLCKVMSEQPRRQGFGLAAMDLAKHFKGPTNVRPETLQRSPGVRLTFTFGEQMYDGAPYIGKPRYTAAPTPEEMQEAYRSALSGKAARSGLAVVRCKVVAGGALSDCGVLLEEPAQAGLGAAVLALTPKFKLATWTDDGLPIVGAFVRVPVKFDPKEAPALIEAATEGGSP